MNTLETKLAAYKKAIDADIAAYIKHLKATTKAQFGKSSALALDAYCDILARGGKRFRGALVIEGYTMCGGTNTAMIMQAARAIEMLHAYLLVIDDIQDRSLLRRGKPTAHIKLTKLLKDHHLGETLATNAALLGCHAAMTILANLDAPAELRSNVLSIVNRTMLVTVHGQIADETIRQATEKDIRNIHEWKTANYTVLNPLHVGMVLAGADCQVTDAITPYALAVGQVFQITNDILGTFSQESGKDLTEDIREGKQTLLIVQALKKATLADKRFLQSCLGNPKLTQKDFKRCLGIIRHTGGLAYAQAKARGYVKTAQASLQQNSQHWSQQGTEFLQSLADYVLVRTS